MKKFTFIESLVVIAIIGILTSILLPAQSNARGAALMKLCISHQRQINIAVQTYATDNEEHVIGDYNLAPSTMFLLSCISLVWEAQIEQELWILTKWMKSLQKLAVNNAHLHNTQVFR